MSADLLRRAADKLRKDVAALSVLWRGQPWFPVFTDSESLTGVRACPETHEADAQSDDCDACDDFETYSEGLAGYVATMHPAVALALAEWLDETAASYRTETDVPECPNCGEGCAGHSPETYHHTCGSPVPCACITDALAVARAVLRLERDHG